VEREATKPATDQLAKALTLRAKGRPLRRPRRTRSLRASADLASVKNAAQPDRRRTASGGPGRDGGRAPRAGDGGPRPSGAAGGAVLRAARPRHVRRFHHAAGRRRGRSVTPRGRYISATWPSSPTGRSTAPRAGQAPAPDSRRLRRRADCPPAPCCGTTRCR
jgi:hypothetical protein